MKRLQTTGAVLCSADVEVNVMVGDMRICIGWRALKLYLSCGETEHFLVEETWDAMMR